MSNPIEEFLQAEEGITKTAAGGSWKSHAGKALAWGAGTAGAALLGHAALEAFDAAKGAVQKSRGFNQMMDQNPGLKKMDRSKVQSIYGTLHRFNPEMAQDPFVAGAWVKRINEYDYVDPRTVGELVSARGRLARPPVDTMALATGMANVGMRSYESAQAEESQLHRMGLEHAFKTKEREAGEDFTTARDDVSHDRRVAENEASSRFNWKMQEHKVHREDERMREKAWLERSYYGKVPGEPPDMAAAYAAGKAGKPMPPGMGTYMTPEQRQSAATPMAPDMPPRPISQVGGVGPFPGRD